MSEAVREETAGIYIPGLKMLKCDECFWCIGHRIKCPAGSKDVLLGGRHPDCPLVSVPPHGRLGEAVKEAGKRNKHE